jgi:hypothetical protein
MLARGEHVACAVFEDDFEWSAADPVAKIDGFLADRPPESWDVLVLAGFTSNKERDEQSAFKVESAEVDKLSESHGAAGFIVNGAYADKILHTWSKAAGLMKKRLAAGSTFVSEEIKSTRTDRAWLPLQKEGNWFGFRDHIGKQRAGMSDIEGQFRDYTAEQGEPVLLLEPRANATTGSKQLSIIVSSYKRPHNLEELVPALLSYPEVGEVIVVNGDKVGASYAGKGDARMTFVDNFDQPEYLLGRYKYASQAKKKTVMFLDDDQLPQREVVRRLLECHAAAPRSLCGTWERRCDYGGHAPLPSTAGRCAVCGKHDPARKGAGYVT